MALVAFEKLNNTSYKMALRAALNTINGTGECLYFAVAVNLDIRKMAK